MVSVNAVVLAIARCPLGSSNSAPLQKHFRNVGRENYSSQTYYLPFVRTASVESFPSFKSCEASGEISAPSIVFCAILSLWYSVLLPDLKLRSIWWTAGENFGIVKSDEIDKIAPEPRVHATAAAARQPHVRSSPSSSG